MENSKTFDEELSSLFSNRDEGLKFDSRLYRSRSFPSLSIQNNTNFAKSKSSNCIDSMSFTRQANDLFSNLMEGEVTRCNSHQSLLDVRESSTNSSFKNLPGTSDNKSYENRRRKFFSSLRTSTSSIAEVTPGPSRQNSGDDNELEEIDQLVATASENLENNDQNNLVELLQRELESYVNTRRRHHSAASQASSREDFESSRSIAEDQRSVSDFDSDGWETSGDEGEDSDRIVRNPTPGSLARHQREFADAIVRMASLDELKNILKNGASVREPVTQGLTPLHYAVWQKYGAAVEFLIQNGCDLNARDDIGYTPLHLCAEHGCIEMLDILLKYNARVNINQTEEDDLYPIDAVDEPLRLALKHDQVETAKILLQNGANPNSRYFFGSEINLLSPLKPELYDLLLRWGARPNTRDRYGFTPIMKACHVQQEAEEALIEKGIISGSEVLQHFAQTLKGIESVLVLISHGADINIRTDARHECRSVLHYAILSGSSPIVDLLLKQGAKVNLEPEYNRASPLHLAALKGDTNIINMLLDADAYINITTPTVGSPLHVACSENIPNRLEVLNLLLERGANPNIVVRSESGRPLRPPLGEYLVNAADHDVEVIRLLLKFGAQVVMQAPQQCPIGLLNCLYNVAKNKDVMIELLEAAERFDIPLIKKTPLLVPSSYRDFFLEVASSPQPLRHLCRTFVRQIMKEQKPQILDGLNLPQMLKLYLMFQIN